MNINEAIELYDSGLTCKEVAKIVGVHPTTLSYHFKKHGVEIRKERPWRLKGYNWLQDILAKGDRESGCWEYPYGTDSTGYGAMMVIPDKAQKVRPHVAALELDGQPRPGNLFALHSCDNRVCVNPTHLRWGTVKDNSQDAIERGRADVESAQKAVKERGFQKNQYGTFPLRNT